MNRILLTSTLLLAGTALTAGAYEMQLPQRKVCTAKAEAIARESIATMRQQQTSGRAGAAKAQEGEPVDLTVCLTPSADGFYTPLAVIALHADEGADADVDPIDFSATLEIPAGTYDVIALFAGPDSGEESMRRPSYAFVIREDMEISMSTEMSISADEATVQTKFRQEMPDGSEMTFPPVTGFDDEGNPIFDEVTEDYKVTALYLFNYLVNADGSTLTFGYMTGYTLPDGTNCEASCDILCNPLSDDWTLAQSRFTMGCWDYPFFAVFSGRQTEEEMKATGSDFINYLDIPTLHTPLADGMGDDSKNSGRVMRVLLNGRQLGSDTFSSALGGPDQEFPKWNIYSSKSSSADPVWITPFFFSYQCDARQMEDDDMLEGYVMAAPLFFDGGVPQFALKGGECFDWESNMDYFPFLVDGSGAPVLAPGHPAFSYTLGQMKMPFGATAPMLTASSFDYSKMEEMPTPFVLPDLWYLGSLGENRYSDWARMRAEVYFNGEKVVESVGRDRLRWGVQSYYSSNPAAGEWLYKLDNANHRAETADGATIAGGNKAEIYLNTNNADCLPPTLRMLQTRNQEGIPTNIFSKAGDATLWLAASDYEMVVDMENYEVWQEMRDAIVTLEFAPYGTGWYEPLTIAEAPAMPTINSLGRVYTANLGEIARSSETGWFDLRVTVTDEAGNYQRQEISPALRIDELTGIAAVSGEREDIRVEGRDIVAPEDARVYTTAGIETRRTSLMPGVYIVGTPRSSRRVIIR